MSIDQGVEKPLIMSCFVQVLILMLYIVMLLMKMLVLNGQLDTAHLIWGTFVIKIQAMKDIVMRQAEVISEPTKFIWSWFEITLGYMAASLMITIISIQITEFKYCALNSSQLNEEHVKILRTALKTPQYARTVLA